jgi:hypothetical protein
MVERLRRNGSNGKALTKPLDGEIMPPQKHAGGAPKGSGSKYDPRFVKQAVKACQAGFTDKELAELFGASEVTINNWKLEHPEFALSLKSGKTPADDRVERSLYHRAIGYTYAALKIQYDKDMGWVEHEYLEHMPPDPACMIFWLKNRRPEQWREKVDHEHKTQITLNITKTEYNF